MSRLPDRNETLSILEAYNDSLIQRHFGNPPANDEDYLEVLREALKREYVPKEKDPDDVLEDLLSHMDFAHGSEEERGWFSHRYEYLRREDRRLAYRVRRALATYRERQKPGYYSREADRIWWACAVQLAAGVFGDE